MNGHHTTGRYTDIRPIGAHIGYRQAVVGNSPAFPHPDAQKLMIQINQFYRKE